jgi:gliding motility-associated transport system ATP-binding protein
MIEVRDLVKRFGEHTAVDGISFEVTPGHVLGFLGPNGAGKSTTMKVITGFIPPSSGTVRVGGLDILEQPIATRRQIGYLPEHAPSYAEMTAAEFLRFCAEVRGFRGAERDARVEHVVETTALHEVRNQIIDTLSKGYRQRVCFAQALLHDPPVLIMDEPTDGLDPNQKHEMREVIRRMGADKTIILSTHILEEMEAVCNRAIIIAKGRIVVDGTPDDLAAMSRYHNAVTLRTRARDDLRERLRKVEGVEAVEEQPGGDGQSSTFEIFPQRRRVILPEVTRFLEDNRIEFMEVYAERGRVDEVFREVTLGAAGAAAEGDGTP